MRATDILKSGLLSDSDQHAKDESYRYTEVGYWCTSRMEKLCS